MFDKEKEKPKNKHATSQESLMQALGFGINELEANRDGKLSTRQINYMKHRRKLLTITAPISCFIMWVFTLFFIVLQVWPLAVVSGTLALLLTIFSIERWKIYNAEALEARAVSIQGHIELSFPLMDENQCNLKIGNLNFKIKKFGSTLAFKNGEPYAIYYAPHSKTILSAEWLRHKSE